MVVQSNFRPSSTKYKRYRNLHLHFVRKIGLKISKKLSMVLVDELAGRFFLPNKPLRWPLCRAYCCKMQLIAPAYYDPMQLKIDHCLQQKWTPCQFQAFDWFVKLPVGWLIERPAFHFLRTFKSYELSWNCLYLRLVSSLLRIFCFLGLHCRL